MKLISIALATFNGARFLEPQLESILSQEQLPGELVVTDDGSIDETIPILHRFASRAPFDVRIHCNSERLGYRMNFRKAASLCSGSFIAFCDQDDVWYPDKLKRLLSAFDDPEVLLAYHNAYVTDGTGEHIRLLLVGTEECHHVQMKPLKPFKSSNGLVQMFRSELRRHDHLWNLSIDENDEALPLAHDQWYFFLAQLLGRVAYLDHALLDYRQHGANTCGTLPVALSRWRRLAFRFEHSADKDERFIQSAAGRARIARELAMTEAGRRDHLLRVAALYDAFAKRLRRRYQTYSGTSLTSRAMSLARSVAAIDYGQRPWRFDARTMARDIWSGVFRGRIRAS